MWRVLKVLLCVGCFVWLNDKTGGRDPLKCAVTTLVVVLVLYGLPWACRWCKQDNDDTDRPQGKEGYVRGKNN